MPDRPDKLSATPAVLTVELDFSHSVEGRPPPPPLTREQAESLGWAMAEDLGRFVGRLDEFGLICLGGLYDMTELLRPGLPMVDVLLDLYLRSLPDTRFQPQLITIGTHGDAFPVPSIAPACQPGAGPLFVIPMLFVGPKARVAELGSTLEKTLLDKGKASMKTADRIAAQFKVQPVNLGYATVNDLCALLRVQLEHNDFGGLWDLLEAALFPRERTHRVVLPEGNVFILRGSSCFTHFPGFSRWAAGRGRDGDLVEAWARWHQRQRQYTAGLLAHGIEVRVTAGDHEPAALTEEDADRAWSLAAMHSLPADALTLREEVIPGGDTGDARGITITEHFLPNLGPVAYTVLIHGPLGEALAQFNDYPLRPEGVREVPGHWRKWARERALPVTEVRAEGLSYRRQPPALVPAGESGANRH